MKLTKGQEQKLDKHLREMEGSDISHATKAAAELAQLLRAYRRRTWRGHSLAALDVRANTFVTASDTFLAERMWEAPHNPGGEPVHWSHGQRIIALTTPSQEQGLVLRQGYNPVFPQLHVKTGLHAMPTVPADQRRELTTLSVEIHTHRLPSDPDTLWVMCCPFTSQRRPQDKEYFKFVDFLKTRPPTLDILDKLYEIWREVHGPATTAWSM
jgi:hypothetical protein